MIKEIWDFKSNDGVIPETSIVGHGGELADSGFIHLVFNFGEIIKNTLHIVCYHSHAPQVLPQ